MRGKGRAGIEQQAEIAASPSRACAHGHMLSLVVLHDYRALHCMLQDTLPFQKNIVVISSVS